MKTSTVNLLIHLVQQIPAHDHEPQL